MAQKEKLKCYRCGWDGDENTGCFMDSPSIRVMYSCKAHKEICDVSGIVFCHICYEDFGVEKNLEKCPRCQIGAIKNHGTV